MTRRCRTSIRAPPGAKLGPRQSLKFRDNMRYLDITRTTFDNEATPCQHGRPVPEAAEESGQPHLGRGHQQLQLHRQQLRQRGERQPRSLGQEVSWRCYFDKITDLEIHLENSNLGNKLRRLSRFPRLRKTRRSRWRQDLMRQRTEAKRTMRTSSSGQRAPRATSH